MSNNSSPLSSPLFWGGLATGIGLSYLSSQYLSRQRQRRLTANIDKALSSLDTDFTVSKDSLSNIVNHFVAQLRQGLAQENQTLKCLPSFVTKRPTGNETGTYIALDLGGTNFRICEVTLEAHGTSRIRTKKFVVSDDLKTTANGEKLFDFFAECVLLALKEWGGYDDLLTVNTDANTSNKKKEPKSPSRKRGASENTPATRQLKLGFTFSFPCQQLALNKGTLIHWTKGFSAGNVEGADVVKLLQDALARLNLHGIQVVALVNDTVGTLMSHAYKDPNTVMGVILGTGTNAAYFEKVSRIPKLTPSSPSSPTSPSTEKEMVINIEWGAFDNELKVLPFTSYDASLDKDSIHPGKQIFEKMISGMYLGEIVRLVMVDFIRRGILFTNDKQSSCCSPLGDSGVWSYKSSSICFSPTKTKQPSAIQVFSKPGIFETAYMSRIERDHSDHLSDIATLFESFANIPTSYTDRKIIKKICECIGTRSARLSAAAITAVLTQSSSALSSGATVAVDGSLFLCYPHYKSRVKDALKELLGAATSEGIVLDEAGDGSGLGAAVIAALA